MTLWCCGVKRDAKRSTQSTWSSCWSSSTLHTILTGAPGRRPDGLMAGMPIAPMGMPSAPMGMCIPKLPMGLCMCIPKAAGLNMAGKPPFCSSLRRLALACGGGGVSVEGVGGAWSCGVEPEEAN